MFQTPINQANDRNSSAASVLIWNHKSSHTHFSHVLVQTGTAVLVLLIPSPRFVSPRVCWPADTVNDTVKKSVATGYMCLLLENYATYGVKCD